MQTIAADFPLTPVFARVVVQGWNGATQVSSNPRHLGNRLSVSAPERTADETWSYVPEGDTLYIRTNLLARDEELPPPRRLRRRFTVYMPFEQIGTTPVHFEAVD